jgi:hypothetical protein
VALEEKAENHIGINIYRSLERQSGGEVSKKTEEAININS